MWCVLLKSKELCCNINRGFDGRYFLKENNNTGYQEARLTFAFAIYTLKIPSASSTRPGTGQRLTNVQLSRERLDINI